jgi:hypothetical protein
VTVRLLSSRSTPGQARCLAQQSSKDLADLTEIQAGVEMLDQVKDVALGLAERIPPPSAIVVDNQDLSFSATMFQSAPRALAGVELPAMAHALEHGGAMHAGSEQLQFGVVEHGAVLPAAVGRAQVRGSSAFHRLPFSARRPRSRRGARAPPYATAAQRLPLRPAGRER